MNCLNRWGISAVLSVFSFVVYAHHPILEGFIAKKITSGLNATSMIQAPDGRFFITEKDGRVRVVKNGELLDTPFLTLTVDNEGERGIQSTVLDPAFETNNYVYVYYSVFNGNHNRVSRFIANGDVVLQGSEEVLLELDQLTGTVHNGGAMKFGPDGKLYISTGDGGWDVDAPQKFNSLRGKILRINSDGSIPEDNPYYSTLEGKYRLIYALGLRNPFTMAFNPATGKLFVNDVGLGSYEEVNEVEPQANFGWPVHEGPVNNSTIDNYKNPVYYYSHDVGCAITGAAFFSFESTNIPEEYLGSYVFGEYCTGNIMLLNPVSHQVIDTLISEIYTPVSFVAGLDGHFYYLNRGETSGQYNSNAGELWQISYVGTGEPYISDQSENDLYTINENAEFSVTAGGQGELSFSWISNDVVIPSADTSNLVLTNVQLADSGQVYYCIVENQFGKDTSKAFVLRVTDNQRPTSSIITPEDSNIYRGGDTLYIKGSAIDPENGIFAKTDYNWTILFHHDDHVHPGLSFSGNDSLMYVIPQIGETSTNVWYEIILSVKDDIGLESVSSHNLYPQKSEVQVFSSPQGMMLNLDGTPTQSNFTVEGVVGVLRSLSAPERQQIGLDVYSFNHWSNGDTNSILNFAPTDTAGVLIAYYEKAYINQPDNGFEVFPNPSDGNFTMLLEAKRVTQVIYTIYDSKFLKVETGNFVLHEGENEVQVNLSHLKPGLYILKTDLPEPNSARTIIIH